MPEGQLDCWGCSAPTSCLFDEGPWVDFTLEVLSGLDSDGRLITLAEREVRAVLPEISEIATGSSHSCWLVVDGQVDCVGQSGHGQLDAPSRSFRSIAVATGASCGVTSNGDLECWGCENQSDGSWLIPTLCEPPPGQFDRVWGELIRNTP